jgi:hypothetical protein
MSAVMFVASGTVKFICLGGWACRLYEEKHSRLGGSVEILLFVSDQSYLKRRILW